MFINPADSVMQSIQTAHDMLVKLTDHRREIDELEAPEAEIIRHDHSETNTTGHINLVA